MHDIDRIRFETSSQPQWEAFPLAGEADTPEVFEYEESGEADELTSLPAAEGPFNEAELMELASEMLEVQSDAELDQFLGKLVRRAGRAAGGFVRSPAGRALGGLLKGAARQVLPAIGSAVGGYIGGPLGANLGGQAASQAGRWFGLELEGLSGEDQEFEVAKRFVQFGGRSAQHLAAMGQAVDPMAAARQAAIAAARVLAPGLLGGTGRVSASTGPASQGLGVASGRNAGRWTRRGNRIVLHGV